ncbi:MAG: hypothetical protein JWM96_647 [Alphaproteobacteria bacterium]|nr:hypothetical protein [Alphaproteobacteria bacterium]
MRRLISNLISLAMMVGLVWGFIQYAPPFYARDFLPDYPMTATVGGQNYYVPLRFIDPHYEGDAYQLGKETVMGLRLDPGILTLVPQDAPGTGADKPLEVAVSSDQIPSTKKAGDDYAARVKKGGFSPYKYGLKVKNEGSKTVYLGKDTLITCELHECLLFGGRKPPLRAFIVFQDRHLPDWDKMLPALGQALAPLRQAPGMGGYIKSIAPSWAEKFFAGFVKDTQTKISAKQGI